MKMKENDNNVEINVVEHIILKNYWEYYITDENCKDDDIRFALVMGFETELGYISLSEIKPYIMTRTKNIIPSELMPATGWHWKKGE